jgi:hypothetical protein
MPEERNIEGEMKAYLDAELRKLAVLPPSELQVALRPILEPFIQMAQALQFARRAWLEWVEQHYEALYRAGQVVREVTEKVGSVLVEWDEASRRFAEILQEVGRLADFGWTLPMQLSVSELVEFLASADADAAASYMLRKLAESDPELVEMERRLSQEAHLAEFRTVLPQCFRAIRRGDYAIAVPPLIAMLERVIQTLNPNHLQANTNVTKTLGQRGEIARRAQEDLFCSAVWISLFKVVGRLWDHLPLKIPENFGLSRNGVQHGRTEPPNTKAEVIRLLNALETALALHDLLKEDKEFSIRQQGGERDIKPMFALIRANFYLPRGRFLTSDADSDAEGNDDGAALSSKTDRP